jgi:hypothetical protein
MCLEVRIINHFWHVIIYKHGDGDNLLTTLAVTPLFTYIYKQNMCKSICRSTLCNVIYLCVCDVFYLVPAYDRKNSTPSTILTFWFQGPFEINSPGSSAVVEKFKEFVAKLLVFPTLS